MGLSREDVIKVAQLARLELSEAEIAALTSQLGDVLTYIEQLSKLDTEGVEPMAHAVEMVNVLAEDVIEESFDREQILSNAPSRDDTCYRVPPVLGE
ncbi:MAG: Asp-tRNA(Asn)/Glu-tRNA(Gln) amidotransferase subunit GatC [Pirellulales bacterium]|jgi:aspartyl-tRNA(Asn)/glutamyl-tRNA(Gln) amidotransferase subunit C|nr:Asp-tRNA(Asn)/Glu-tRNA(Gln) amidotransferase subunit GatC [Pirellulales bacterium]HJN65800.1 Asp-tRNA(Asn)/Glu-tRNA(Gln) amidotransferase subunit GatC [Pirellulales bacterium]